MSQVPPPIYSNYPRQTPQTAWPIRPPGVYFFDAIGDAWAALFAQLAVWLPAMLLVGLSYLLIVAAQLAVVWPDLMSGASTGMKPTNNLLASLVQIVPYTILSCLLSGALVMGVRQLNGEVIGVGMVFAGFRRFGAILAITVFQTAVTLGGQILLIGNGNLTGGPFGSLVISLVVFCVLAIAYTAVIYPLQSFALIDLVLHSDKSLIRTVREAYRRTWSPVLALKFLLLSLILGLACIAGYCACVVGLLFALPLFCLVYALHYRYFYLQNDFPAKAAEISIGLSPPE